MVASRFHKALAMCLMLALMCVLPGCGSKRPAVTTAAFHTVPTECLGKQGGEVILKVSAYGFSLKDAIENAKRKAIEEITFTGIHAGDASVSAYPLVDDPTAKTRYADFFNKFLSSDGKYNQYARAEKSKTVESYYGEDRMMCVVTVIVDKTRLREYYVKEKILPKTK